MQENDAKRLAKDFRSHWRTATDDNELSLFSFRRYRTSHLINLRFLENEVERVTHEIYQAGLQVEIKEECKKKLGLQYATRNPNTQPIEEVITRPKILELRALMKEYGERFKLQL